MHASTLQSVLEHLRKLTDPARAQELSDADLLERFRLRREEAAFTLLLQRHGPMVLAVCRRVLGNAHDAEDAFQATFLVLVRDAGAIRKQESLAGWLHGVALRIAHKARMRSAKLANGRRQPAGGADPPADPGRSPIIYDDPSDTLAAAELRAALDEEIECLPDKYRTPLVLCYLADKTHEQAAVELGWPKSSVTARLARARELLQRRLIRRGFTAPAGLLAVLLTEESVNAAIPSLLTLSTVRLAVQALTGETLAATSAAALAGSFVKSATTRKLGAMLALLTTLGFAVVGYRMAVPGSPSPLEQPATKAKIAGERHEAKSKQRKPRVDLFGDVLPDEAVARMGSNRLRHSSLRSLYFSSDSKNLVSYGYNDLRIWDAATGKLLRRFESSQGQRQSSCREVGDSIVRGVVDNKGIVTLQVLDAAAGIVRRQASTKEQAWVLNPIVSPDGKQFAVVHQNDLRLYDSTTGETVQRMTYKGVGVFGLAFAPDSKTIAFNDLSTDTIYLYETTTGKLVRELKQHGDTSLHLVFSPDGRFLASMPRSREARKGEMSIWNVRDFKEVQRWTHPFPQAWSAAFSPDAKLVAIDGVRWGLVLRDVETGKVVRRLSPHGGIYDMAFSPDGKTFATASERGAIRLWDVATGKLLPASADPDVLLVDRLRFSADGKRLFGDADACLVWDPSTGRELGRFADPKPLDFSRPNDTRHLVLSPDESLLALSDAGRPITLWDSATGKEKHTLKGQGFVYKLLFTPDSRRLISTGSDNLVHVWDVASGRELYQLTGRNLLTVTPDGRYLAAGPSWKSTNIFVYDLTSGRETKRFIFSQGGGQISGLAFAADGRSLAAVGRVGGVAKRPGVVKVWDAITGELVHSFDDQKAMVWSVAFSPDGRTVATGDANGSLLLWELASGRQRHAFAEHESQIVSLAFSPNGRTLAASSADAPVYVWDVAGILQSEPRRLSNDELQRCWTALAGNDAIASFQAIRRLAAAPVKTLPFLRQHLKPVPAPDRKRIRQLVDMLDSDDFASRQKAAEELAKQADAAAGLLRQILAKEKPSLEVRRRLQQILEGIESNPEALRAVRAVEVLEWIATPDAVHLIGELANGAADARLTREAAAAKRRLSR